MVYIIILNWKGAVDTLACLKSLIQLHGVEYRLVVCDNASPDHSYEHIRAGLQNSANYVVLPLIELERNEAEQYVIPASEQNAVYLIQTGDNLGYAGGNNVGIRFALNQADMRYVWLLNNDTEVAPDALLHMVQRCQTDPNIGICGSRLVYFHDRAHLQGLGGNYNRWLGTTRHYAAHVPSDAVFDDDIVSAEIDYVIGASMLLTRQVLERIGLLCEDYFLYFEELDMAMRASPLFKISVATNSIVYHKEGGSSKDRYPSLLADNFAIRSRLLFSNKFYPFSYWIVRFSLIFVFINRLKQRRYSSARNIVSILIGI
jgi:GT2 family glycosyltransferase